MGGELIDSRERNFFHMDNVVVDEYLPLVGHTAFVVYAYLLRRAGNKTVAWPSYSAMQRDLGIGRNQVAQGIRKLVEHRLVRVEKGEKAAVNRYHLITPGSLAEKLVSDRNQSRSETETSFPARPKLVSQRDSKNTHGRILIEGGEVSASARVTPPAYGGARARVQPPAPTIFCPGNPVLPPDELAADAAAVGATPEEYKAILSAWGDRRANSRALPDWRADARAFVRSWRELEPKGASAAESARASPNLSPYVVPDHERTPTERAWDEASEEERKVGWKPFVESFQRGEVETWRAN